MWAWAGVDAAYCTSKVSRWLGAPLRLMKMQARAVERGFTPTAFTWASPRRASAANAAQVAALESSSRRLSLVQLGQFFIESVCRWRRRGARLSVPRCVSCGRTGCGVHQEPQVARVPARHAKACATSMVGALCYRVHQ